jgi:flagellar hook assembly protein FlgD
MATEGHVQIEVFNVRGQRVISLVNEHRLPGSHRVVWEGTDSNGRAVSSGLYFYRMTTGEFTQTRRMLLMK